MKKNDFDLFIIGAGSGGVRAARLAASMGIKVGIAEEFRYGGTCVIRGCVPKKLMVNAADFQDYLTDAKGFGWDIGSTSFSWDKFLSAKNKEIERLENIYFKILQNSGVQTFGVRAKFLSSNSVELSDGTICYSKVILIATGGVPFVPNFAGKEYAITSNEIFELESLPNRILIVGGGYIASEFAGILNGMGVEVTQMYRGEKLLRGFDEDIRDHVSIAMLERGINVKCGVDVLECKKDNSGLSVNVSNGSIIDTDCLLFATGRKPNTLNLGLEKTRVSVDKEGAIKINKLQRTSDSSIYAIGDVTNRLNLTPVAIRDAIAFVDTVFKNKPVSPDYEVVPTAVFTRPEVGTVGLTEAQASLDYSIKIYKTTFKPLANAIAGRKEVTIMKMIVDEVTRKVLGCHLVGPNSSELIQLVAVAIKMGARKEDFDKTCAVHPTAAEELVTLN